MPSNVQRHLVVTQGETKIVTIVIHVCIKQCHFPERGRFWCKRTKGSQKRIGNERNWTVKTENDKTKCLEEIEGHKGSLNYGWKKQNVGEEDRMLKCCLNLTPAEKATHTNRPNTLLLPVAQSTSILWALHPVESQWKSDDIRCHSSPWQPHTQFLFLCQEIKTSQGHNRTIKQAPCGGQSADSVPHHGCSGLGNGCGRGGRWKANGKQR